MLDEVAVEIELIFNIVVSGRGKPVARARST
jgi:hypothetical protein